MPIQNVAEYVQRHAAESPDKAALIAHHARCTYGELWQRSGEVAGGLAARGLLPGDRVVVMIPMSVDLYVVLIALFRLGAIGVFVDPWVGARQIAAFAAYAEPKGFIGISRSHFLRLLERDLRRIPLTVTTGPCWLGLPAHDSLAALSGPAPPIHQASPTESALITFTTGSSGTPKGANRTHGYLTSQHLALKAAFPYQDDTDMPMFPVFALNNLALGLTTVIPELDFRRLDRLDAQTVLEQMRDHIVTTATGSPTFFDRLFEHAARHPELQPPLRRILAGGAPITDQQLETWQQFMPDTEIMVVYGSTEAEPVAHLSGPERLAASSSSRPETPGICAGDLVPQVEARIIRIHDGPVRLEDEGWEAWDVSPGWIGELIVTGEHVCQDYYRNPDAVAANKIQAPDGRIWHRMGDTGYLDEDGRFWLAGRVHSTIRRQGQLLHPLLIEQAARANDNRLQAVAVVGLPDAQLGERVVAVLQTSATAPLEAIIKRRVSDCRLVVDDVVVTEKPLPMDPRHHAKVDYPALRQALLAGEFAWQPPG